MAIIYATLAHEDGGEIEYIYPKSVAEMIEYDNTDSVKSKIEKLDNSVLDIDNRLTVISETTSNDVRDNREELVDLRTPTYTLVPEGTVYEYAGTAVRAQLEVVKDLIDDLDKSIVNINNWASGDSSDNNPIAIHNADENAHSDIRALIENLKTNISEIEISVGKIQLATQEDIDAIIESLKSR